MSNKARATNEIKIKSYEKLNNKKLYTWHGGDAVNSYMYLYKILTALLGDRVTNRMGDDSVSEFIRRLNGHYAK